MPTAVIVDAVRTPFGRGKPGGALSGIHPVDLAAHVLRSLIERNSLDSAMIDDVIMGNFGQVGEQSWNVARHALLSAGIVETVPATTVDRQCGSSQQAAHFAAQGVIAGAYDVVIAAGVESMSRVPLGMSHAGGDPISPGIRARYPDGLVNQGIAAELIAAKWGFSREELDEYSARSHLRASTAADAGRFSSTIVPIEVTGPEGNRRVHAFDETVRPGTSVETLATLPPAYYDGAMANRFPEITWNITAGNASPLTDGASALLIMSEEKAHELGLTPRARFHAFTVVGDDPIFMLTGPIPATRKILERTGLTMDDIDAYEVNEAFASVPLAWAKEMGADPTKLNPWGGAIAIGHPLGASGARLMGNLLAYLEATGGRYGLQVICEGGGMANATIIERLS